MSKEIMQQALDALENHSGNYKLTDYECTLQLAVENALLAAIAQPATPPVVSDLGNEAAISAAMAEGNKHGVKSSTAARIVAAYLTAYKAQPVQPKENK